MAAAIFRAPSGEGSISMTKSEVSDVAGIVVLGVSDAEHFPAYGQGMMGQAHDLTAREHP